MWACRRLRLSPALWLLGMPERSAADAGELRVGATVKFLADADELEKENTKDTTALKGSIVFSVAKANNSTGEIAGVFESIQPSDTDLGSKAPKDVKITGLWYGQLKK